MTEKTDKKIGYKDVFRQKEYLKMIWAALINRFGDSIDAVASAWIVYELTNNAAWSAVIFGVNKLPSVVITPFAGAWVEGRNKKNIMVITDIIRAVCVAFVATGYLLGFLQAWMLLITTFTISTVEAFRGPANTALTPKILEKEYYEFAMSLMSTLTTLVELIGTAVAAAIIAGIGTAGAIYVDMITFVLSAAIIATVHSGEEKSESAHTQDASYKETLIEGFRYVKKEHIVLMLVAVCVFLNAVLVPFNSLQAPLSSEILHGGAEILSILGAAAMIGMLLGSITYPVISNVMSGKGIIFLGGVCIGAYYILLVVCQPFYENKIFMYALVSVTSLIFGYFAAVLMAYVNVQVVKCVKEEYLARVGAILTAFASAATPVVSFLLGIVAVFVSTEIIFLVTGIIGVVCCVLLLFSKAFDEDNVMIVTNA
jgi:MFS family permease